MLMYSELLFPCNKSQHCAYIIYRQYMYNTHTNIHTFKRTVGKRHLTNKCFFSGRTATPLFFQDIYKTMLQTNNHQFCFQSIYSVNLFRGGGISFNTGGSISTSWMWKLSPGKLPFPRTWNNKEMDIFLYTFP